MAARRLSTKRYIIAGIITALVFLLGLSFGMVFENARVSENENRLKDQEATIASLQLQYFYINEMQNSEDVCPVLMTALTDSIERLGDSLGRVEQSIEDNKMNIDEKERILRVYAQDNLRYWLFSRTVREKCQSNTVNILYFFDNDCSICPDQGVVLTYFKKKYQDNILIFPINLDIDEEMIDLVKTQYNITTTPTIVVNGKAYPGIVNENMLGDILCQEFNTTEACS